jgi:hypothetical protein
MKPISNRFRRAGVQRLCRALLTVMTLASFAYAQTSFAPGEKAKVKGAIMSRKGDLVKVQDTKTGTSAIVKITDDTKIIRNKLKVVSNSARIVRPQSQTIFAATGISRCGGFLYRPATARLTPTPKTQTRKVASSTGASM